MPGMCNYGYVPLSLLGNIILRNGQKVIGCLLFFFFFLVVCLLLIVCRLDATQGHT